MKIEHQVAQLKQDRIRVMSEILLETSSYQSRPTLTTRVRLERAWGELTDIQAALDQAHARMDAAPPLYPHGYTQDTLAT